MTFAGQLSHHVSHRAVSHRAVAARLAPPSIDSGQEPDRGLLGPGETFAALELRAMQLDGVLQHVFGFGYLPVGVPERLEHRAIAMSLDIPAHLAHSLILGRLSAAWVYGCGDRPARVTALIDHKRRSGALPPFTALQVHEVTLGSFDVAKIAGVRITSVLRTAVDLAFLKPSAAPGWSDPLPVLWSLSQDADLGCPLSLIKRAIMALPRVPYKQQALNRVEKLIAEGLCAPAP